jgi:long-subunit acyl-CoA synthetase (AMP-forming)
MSSENPASLAEIFQSTAAEFAGEVALRTLEEGSEISWSEYASRVERIARGLTALGVGPGDTVAVMTVNRPEFHLVDAATLHLGATPFAIYATSAVDQIAYLFENAANRVVVTERAFLNVVREAVEKVPTVAEVVVIDEPGAGLEELERRGEEEAGDFDFEAAWRAVEPEDIATLIYTSGTTGPPKGVMLSHANLIAVWESSIAALEMLEKRGSYMSYLPTAHIADRIFSHYPAMNNGSTITCVPDMRAAVSLLATVRPTVWLAVPRIWEKLKDAIEAMRAAAPDPAQLSDEVVRKTLGLDAAELLVSGAAPIRADVLEFFQGLGVEICEGYGMTESTGVGTVNVPGETRIGTVGRPSGDTEIELAEDGEILIRGGIVMVGYRGEPEKTAETIDPQGWLHTGDIGRIDDDGYLSVIDRKKELIINAAGKNMSPANIEAHLKSASPLISFAVAIGDGRRYNTALLSLDPDALALRAQREGIADASPAAMSRDPKLLAELEAAVAEANSKMSRVEQIKRWSVVPEVWEPGGKLVTPTIKLKRKPINEEYSELIASMYPDG